MPAPRFLAAALLALGPAPLVAQGWIEPPDRPGPVLPRHPVTRVSSAVRVALDGRVARFEVEELFRNDGPRVAEGSYHYPVPADAAFTSFSLFAGDQELRGEMLPADRARAIYEEIVRRQKDPALLTLAGHGLFRAQVFPIQPGETRKVILRYSQTLDREGDALRIRYPLGARTGGPVAVTVTAPDAARLGVPFSPTHQVTWNADRDRLVVRVEAEPRGDLELLLPVRTGLVGTSVVTHAPGGGERFALFVLSPPPAGAAAAMPRDLTLVVDVSGSMSGAKLEQARAALHQALGSLRAGDRFRLITFASTVTHFEAGFAPATAGALARAREFVDRLDANGGTNIAGALGAALGGPAPSGRMGILLFLTDGLPSVGEQAPERLAADAAARRGETRIFPIGVGHDVNTYLLDRLAAEGRGRVEYVAPQASVEAAVGRVMARVDAPALVNLRLVRAPVPLVDLAPARLPDLFYGDDLVLLARYRGEGTGEVVFEGERNGRRERFSTRVAFPAHAPGHGYIPQLWAARRIGELTRTIRLEGETPALVAEVRDLGLRYGILTEYTSYLVLEPGAVVAQRASPAAPAEQTGRQAFDRAELSARLAESRTLAAADEAALRVAAPRPGAPEVRREAGRVFVRRDGVWTDLAHADSVRIVTVAPFSPAYFDLVRALPELVPFLPIGDELLVAGRTVSVRVAPAGLTAWGPGALDAVVRGFRGR